MGRGGVARYRIRTRAKEAAGGEEQQMHAGELAQRSCGRTEEMACSGGLTRGVLSANFALSGFFGDRQSIEQVHLFVIRIQKSTNIFLGFCSELFVNTRSYPLGKIVKNVLAFNFL